MCELYIFKRSHQVEKMKKSPENHNLFKNYMLHNLNIAQPDFFLGQLLTLHYNIAHLDRIQLDPSKVK